jgi:hypothetical protein
VGQALQPAIIVILEQAGWKAYPTKGIRVPVFTIYPGAMLFFSASEMGLQKHPLLRNFGKSSDL